MNNQKRINQGYEIIDSVEVADVEVVIGHNPRSPNPYVCWYCKNGDYYYWGHYCNTLEAAQKKFSERVDYKCSFPSRHLMKQNILESYER